MTAGRYRDVDVAGAVELARSGYRVVDVREADEWAEGHVTGATHIPLVDVPARLPELIPDRTTPLLLYCRSGARSGRAAAWLAQAGYTEVVNLNGYSAGWSAAGGDWEQPPPQAPEAAARYARQLALREVGLDGQRRLLTSRVLVVGAGGLGSPAAMYLAAAGVGTVGIADHDVVEEGNLNRQLLHGTGSVGLPKVASAARALALANPDTRVEAHPMAVTAANARELVAAYDVVIDATDSLDARYVLNDAAVELRRPLIHGSVHRWSGQVTTIVPFDGPCYRCLFPVQPPAELAPDCDVTGVLGVLPGIVGTIQATEAIKVVLDAGEPLVGRLLTLDALGMTVEEISVERDPACPSCGSRAFVDVAPASSASGP